MDQQRLQELIGADYTLQWIIGQGGMSTVWLADDNLHEREVAIKVLRPEFSDNDEFLGRFRNEAATAQQIHSDNVVETYDYREFQDANGAHFCFMALEYIRGESLADLLAREKQLPEAQALDVLEQAAHGLSVIHSMGMVHRDIKPGNLMITANGQVKITDFGIAKAAAAVPLTRTGMVVGTAQYVSPEQAQGQDVTSASDVYSLGVVGYEMLAGKRPFVGDSSVSVALAHISQVPDPLSTQISAPTRELVGIALRKDPATRYPDGSEFAQAISDVRLGRRPRKPSGAPQVSDVPSVSPTASTQVVNATGAVRTKPRWGIVGILIACVVAAAVGWALTHRGAGSNTPVPAQTSVVTQWLEPANPPDSGSKQDVTTHQPPSAPEETVTPSPTQVTSPQAPLTQTQVNDGEDPLQVNKQTPQPEVTQQTTAKKETDVLEETRQATDPEESEASPLDSLIIDPTKLAANPKATL